MDRTRTYHLCIVPAAMGIVLLPLLFKNCSTLNKEDPESRMRDEIIVDSMRNSPPPVGPATFPGELH